MKTLSESILNEINNSILTETIGYAQEETINALTSYYMEQTGATIIDKKKTHTTGGGYNNVDYIKVVFDNDAVMVFQDNGHIKVKLYMIGDDYYYDFEIWEKYYKKQLDQFINGEKPEGSYKIYTKRGYEGHPEKAFDIQDAIDNKGKLIVELEKDGDNKEEVFKKVESLSDDGPAILVSGLWNTMNDGKLTTVKKIKEYIDKYGNDIYGGKDELQVYENLVYLHTVSGSEMF